MRNFAPQAQADLDRAVGWLLDQGSAAAAAERLLAAVLEAAELLARRPHLGRGRPDLLAEPFRFWSIPRHHLLLVCRSDAAPPTILRVLSAHQDLGPALAELAGSEDGHFHTPRDGIGHHPHTPSGVPALTSRGPPLSTNAPRPATVKQALSPAIQGGR